MTDGAGAGGTLRFPVTLSAVSGQQVRVNYATADGTATVAGLDYLSTNGTLNFAPGITSQMVNVSINGDATNGPNETMSVRLTAPVNAVLGVSTGTGTRLDDDPP